MMDIYLPIADHDGNNDDDSKILENDLERLTSSHLYEMHTRRARRQRTDISAHMIMQRKPKCGEAWLAKTQMQTKTCVTAKPRQDQEEAAALIFRLGHIA